MFKRLISSIVCMSFICSNLQYSYADVGARHAVPLLQLPEPGVMVGPSAAFTPLALKGIIVNPQKPLEFQFIVDTGSVGAASSPNQEEAERLVKYFLAGLTIPEGDLWVNLSPYEKDRMTTQSLGETELGRDLLAQDYILKQLTASLIYPEKDLGKEFWSRVYKKAQEQFGTTDVPVNTFNKVWILPDQAQVYESAAGRSASGGNVPPAAYVTKSTLKVMLDEDYLAMSKNNVRAGSPSPNKGEETPPVRESNQIGSQIIREIVIPEITKEVNQGKNFAPLRQIYDALILAKWYKETIQNGLLDAVYTNKNKVAGVNLNDPAIKQQIYERYLQAYKKGVFNYIKDPDPTDVGSGAASAGPRKYFSGGLTLMKIPVERNGRQADIKADGAMMSLQVKLVNNFATDVAMISKAKRDNLQKEGVKLIEEIKDVYHKGLFGYLQSKANLNSTGINHLIIEPIVSFELAFLQISEITDKKVNIDQGAETLRNVLDQFSNYSKLRNLLDWAHKIIQRMPNRPKLEDNNAGLVNLWDAAKFIIDGGFTQEMAEKVLEIQLKLERNLPRILQIAQELSQDSAMTSQLNEDDYLSEGARKFVEEFPVSFLVQDVIKKAQDISQRYYEKDLLLEVLATRTARCSRARQAVLIILSIRKNLIPNKILWPLLEEHAYRDDTNDKRIPGIEQNNYVRLQSIRTMAELDLKRSIPYLIHSLNPRNERIVDVRARILRIISGKLNWIIRLDSEGELLKQLRLSYKYDQWIDKDRVLELVNRWANISATMPDVSDHAMTSQPDSKPVLSLEAQAFADEFLSHWKGEQIYSKAREIVQGTLELKVLLEVLATTDRKYAPAREAVLFIFTLRKDLIKKDDLWPYLVQHAYENQYNSMRIKGIERNNFVRVQSLRTMAALDLRRAIPYLVESFYWKSELSVEVRNVVIDIAIQYIAEIRELDRQGRFRSAFGSALVDDFKIDKDRIRRFIGLWDGKSGAGIDKGVAKDIIKEGALSSEAKELAQEFPDEYANNNIRDKARALVNRDLNVQALLEILSTTGRDYSKARQGALLILSLRQDLLDKGEFWKLLEQHAYMDERNNHGFNGVEQNDHVRMLSLKTMSVVELERSVPYLIASMNPQNERINRVREQARLIIQEYVLRLKPLDRDGAIRQALMSCKWDRWIDQSKVDETIRIWDSEPTVPADQAMNSKSDSTSPTVFNGYELAQKIQEQDNKYKEIPLTQLGDALNLAHRYIREQKNFSIEEIDSDIKASKFDRNLLIIALDWFLRFGNDDEKSRAISLIYGIYLETKKDERSALLRSMYQKASRAIDSSVEGEPSKIVPWDTKSLRIKKLGQIPSLNDALGAFYDYAKDFLPLENNPQNIYRFGNALRLAREWVDSKDQIISVKDIESKLEVYDTNETYLVKALLRFLDSKINDEVLKAIEIIYLIYGYRRSNNDIYTAINIAYIKAQKVFNKLNSAMGDDRAMSSNDVSDFEVAKSLLPSKATAREIAQMADTIMFARDLIGNSKSLTIDDLNERRVAHNIREEMLVKALVWFLQSFNSNEVIKAKELIDIMFLSKSTPEMDLVEAHNRASGALEWLRRKQMYEDALRGIRYGEESQLYEGNDQAMLNRSNKSQDLGGIDLNQININRTGKTIKVDFDPAQLDELLQGEFQGFSPVIIDIAPILSPFPLLGISKEAQALAKI